MILAITLVLGVQSTKLALVLHNNFMVQWNQAKAEGRV